MVSLCTILHGLGILWLDHGKIFVRANADFTWILRCSLPCHWWLRLMSDCFTSVSAEFNRMKRSDPFRSRGIFLDGFNIWNLIKFNIHKDVRTLTSVKTFFQSFYLLLFIALYLGTNFTYFEISEDAMNGDEPGNLKWLLALMLLSIIFLNNKTKN